MSTQRERLALDVIALARVQVLASHHYLAGAIGRLRLVSGHIGGGFALATDGSALAYDADRIVREFSSSETVPTHDFLHPVLHCVLLHTFAVQGVDERAWNLACDICVERLTASLLGARAGERGARIGQALAVVETACDGSISAQRVYRQLMRGAWSSFLEDWEKLFASDDHAPWYGSPIESGPDAASGDGFDDSAEPGPGAAEAGEEAGASVGRQVDELDADELREDWKRIARMMKAAIESMPREQGKRAGILVEEVQAAMRERVDYAQWLRQFAAMGEHLRLSDEEFDPVFYTYGLRRYGNLPLIEPLEQREERRIRTFAIVIDTSQSVSGEAVRRFVDETCSILRTSGAFSNEVNLRIIQCDSKVQSDDAISRLEDLRKWGDSVELRGFGGTDFRPAFEYVDGLVEAGELRGLDGLVYFTDGWGTYPERRPEYKVAFVFHDDDHRPQDVPTWAVQVTLMDE